MKATLGVLALVVALGAIGASCHDTRTQLADIDERQNELAATTSQAQTSPEEAHLHRQLAQHRAEKAYLESRYGAEHSAVRQAQAQLEAVEARLAELEAQD